MAADNEKTTVAAEPAPEAKKASGGTKKLFLFGGIGLGVVVIGAALGLYVLKPMLAKSGTEGGEEAATHETEKKHDAKDDKSQAKADKKKDAHGGGGLVYAIEDIVVNPAGTGGTRFLMVSLGFDIESPELASMFESREPQVRDILITVLSSKTVAELTDPKQKELMRLQIKKRLAQAFETEQLAAVYFTDFVLQ